MPGEKAEKREEKANYSSKNIDLLGLADSNQNLPRSNSTCPSNSYFVNSLRNQQFSAGLNLLPIENLVLWGLGLNSSKSGHGIERAA